MGETTDRARVKRELARLEDLAAKRRFRVRLLRGGRGFVGAAASLAAMLRFKLAGSLGLKVALAAVVGLGFAWPAAALLVLLVLGLVLAFVSLLSGEAGAHDFSVDCPCDCKKKERRAARLEELIEQRTTWLAATGGRPPSVLKKPRARAST